MKLNAAFGTAQIDLHYSERAENRRCRETEERDKMVQEKDNRFCVRSR